MDKNYNIVYVDMVGDMFHINHVKFLKKCKKMCKFLYVGIHSDKTVTEYKRQPIMTMEERIGVVKSCKYVNKVIENAPIVPNKLFLDKYNIDMVVHAHDINEDEKYKYMYKECVIENKFTRIDYQKGVSTTEVINRLLKRYYKKK
jgi:cytidyltransferase-like protein